MTKSVQSVFGYGCRFVVVFLTAGLVACGGGGGGESGPTFATGRFIDSVVEGLGYTTSAGQTGITDANGRFSYQVGSTVTFTLGGVTIGTASGQNIVTPVTLAGSGSATGTQATNITRFLMMLDTDGDPANGITISSAVRTAASSWMGINFATVNLDTDANVASIVASVGVADSRTASLPSISAAQNHLTTTILCAVGGAYSGSWSGNFTISGPVSGNWAFALDPLDGTILGYAYDGATLAASTVGFLVNGTLTTSGTDNFVAGDAAGATFTGTADLSGSLSGAWDDTSTPPDYGSGTYSGSKIVVSLPPSTPGTVYYGVSRGTASPPSTSTFIAAIDGDTITGNGIDLIDMTSYTFTGTVTGGVISGSTSKGAAFIGTLNANGTFNGSFTSGGDSGTFNACQAMLVGL